MPVWALWGTRLLIDERSKIQKIPPRERESPITRARTSTADPQRLSFGGKDSLPGSLLVRVSVNGGVHHLISRDLRHKGDRYVRVWSRTIPNEVPFLFFTFS